MALALVPEYPSTVPLIDLTNTGFSPAQTTIAAGVSVTFRNSTNIPHTLIGDGTVGSNDAFLPLIRKGGTAVTTTVAPATTPPNLLATASPSALAEPLVNTCRFQVPLPPGAEYTHQYGNAGNCHVSLVTAVYTANITVNATNGPASLTGRVLDTTNAVQGSEEPIVGALVSLLDTNYIAVTDNQGYFTLSGIAPAGEHVLDIDTTNAQPAPNGAGYAGFREKIEIVAGIANVVDRPFYLPRLDMDSLTTVNPATITTVNNPNLDITMTVPANTALAGDGSLFDGDLSISEVPLALAPAALPADLDPGLLITIQPVGVTFDTPVPITFPNYDNLAPGNELDLWSLDPKNGEFIVVGTGQVSADGSAIEMIAGGIRAADWHLVMPPRTNPNAKLKSENTGNGDSGCMGSTVTYHSGCLGTNITLPAYTSLGEQQALSLVYKSERAYPYLTIPFETTVLRRAAVPALVSYQLNIGGVDVGQETFLDTSGFNELLDEPLHATASAAAGYFSTGAYRYNIKTSSHYPNSKVTSRFNGRVSIVNEQNSPLGAGWGLNGLLSLHTNEDGSYLIADGSGSAQIFSSTSINLTDWTKEGFAPGGNWVVASDGVSVLQTGHSNMGVNLGPSFFISTDEYINTTLRGNILVQDVFNDDDYVGFLFGYQSPLAANGDASNDYQFLLFDWKRLAQSFSGGYAPEGFSLLRANGRIFNYLSGFYNHVNSSRIEILATDFGDDKGWEPGVTHDFELVYEEERIQISIDGKKIFDVSGTFPAGRFGFYTYSQAGITYSNLVEGNTIDSYRGPDGDFSELFPRENGEFLLRYKDGTEITFNAAGLQTAVSDPNGNTTTYTYDNQDRLTTITDPVGLVTTLTYGGNGRLQTVTDPAGRITTFSHNGAGDLTSVTFPDGKSRSFGYDSRHLMTAETDENGQTTSRVYNEYGQITSATLPDGTVRQASASLSVGLVPQGQGTIDNPAPVTRPNANVSTYTDGEGHVTIYGTGRFGEATRITDPAGFSTAISRDIDGNPTQTSLPSGAIFNRTFDAQGNMLTFHDATVNGTTNFTYEPLFNQVTAVTDPFNQTTRFAYDGQGNLTQLTTPLNRSVTFAYNNRGLVSNMTDTLGTPASYSYNPQGNLTSLTQGTGSGQRTASMTYTPAGYLDTLTDPLGRLFTFTYDVLGRLTQEILPGGRTINYAYDSAGNLTSLTPPSQPPHTFAYSEIDLLTAYNAPPVAGGGSNQTRYSYNHAQQLTQVVRPDGLTLDYGYDAAGRLGTVTVPNGSYSYSYSPTTGQLASLSDSDGGALSYRYSGELLTQVNWTGAVNGFVGYGYDAGARLRQLNINGVITNFSYDADNMLTQAGDLTLTYDPASGLISGSTQGVVSDSWQFNAFAELSGYTATVGGSSRFQTQYSRDALGRITQKVEVVNGTTTTTDYAYDAAGRLWQVWQNGVLQATYSYDPNGNRLSDGSNNATYDDQDRLLTYGTASYTYTANGELLTKMQGGQTTTYDYDVLGNLRGVGLPNGTQIEYVIDAADRRIGKRVNGVLQKGFLYGDDLNPVAELDGSGNVVSRFIYASQSNVPDTMIKNGTTYRLISDHLGSVRFVINASTGAIAQQLNYDAWGVLTEDSNPGFQPFGFAGGLYDPDTGLVRFGARDYDAQVGRWTAKDPIGFSGGDENLYVYVENDSMNYLDSTGKNPSFPQNQESSQDSSSETCDSEPSESEAVGVIQALFPAHTAQFSKNPIGGSVEAQMNYADQINRIRRLAAEGGLAGVRVGPLPVSVPIKYGIKQIPESFGDY
ncbi:MAG: hypothetical protein KDE56_11305 [Anaerolineales bacterium]|nr:hypothetical protein [Anaerolineales bacterium]